MKPFIDELQELCDRHKILMTPDSITPKHSSHSHLHNDYSRSMGDGMVHHYGHMVETVNSSYDLNVTFTMHDDPICVDTGRKTHTATRLGDF